MRFQRTLSWSLLLVMLVTFGIGGFYRPGAARAAPSVQASAYELILAMNTLRVSNGLPALIEDPIVNAVAQSTAAIMAANNMSWHIGDVRGRIAAAGTGKKQTFNLTDFYLEINLVDYANSSTAISAARPVLTHSVSSPNESSGD